MPRTVAEINRIVRTLTRTSRHWSPTAVGIGGPRVPRSLSCSHLVSHQPAHQGRGDRRGLGPAISSRHRTPRTMADLPAATIARAIYPAGFYRTKAETIRSICTTLLERTVERFPTRWRTCWPSKVSAARPPISCSPSASASPASAWTPTSIGSATDLGSSTTKTPEQTESALRQVLPVPTLDSVQRPPRHVWPEPLQAHFARSAASAL